MPFPPGFVPPCLPTLAYKVPIGPDWIHEAKHDGYRLQVRRDAQGVRLFTRRGFDWTERYPAIVRTALELPAVSCTLDGEAVVCGGDGIAVFADLHRRGVVTDAMLYAFDVLEFGGEDLRPFPLSDRKRLPAKLVGKAMFQMMGVFAFGVRGCRPNDRSTTPDSSSLDSLRFSDRDRRHPPGRCSRRCRTTMPEQ